MPNHITNVIRFDSPEEMERVLEAVQSENNKFDFNQIIPMPTELRDLTSPIRYVTEEKRLEQLLDVADWKIDKNGFKPELGLTKELEKQYLEEFGATDWYRWSIDNWDTKWNAYSVDITDDTITFDTAWGHPDSIINKLSEMFPNISFHIQYADEDTGHNLGVYTITDGCKSDQADIIEGSDEAIKLACEIKGYDYQDYLKEMEEYA